MPRKSELTDSEVLDYYEASQLRRESIVDSISKLRKRSRRAGDAGEVAENDEKILDLMADKALVDAKRIAFDANEDSINPPSEEQLDALGRLVAAVEALTAKRRILREVVTLTTRSLNTFREIHPGSA